MSCPAILLVVLPMALLQGSSATHCSYNMTKPGQVIDVKLSTGLESFEDIGVLHVDGKTPLKRMDECVDICCHAGAECNVVALDIAMKGKDGDNCHLYKCDPPESCRWTTKEGSQSVLLYILPTTTPHTVKRTLSNDITDSMITSFDITSTPTAFLNDTIDVTALDSDSDSDSDGNGTMVTSDSDSTLMHTNASSNKSLTTEASPKLTKVGKKISNSTVQLNSTIGLEDGFGYSTVTAPTSTTSIAPVGEETMDNRTTTRGLISTKASITTTNIPNLLPVDATTDTMTKSNLKLDPNKIIASTSTSMPPKPSRLSTIDYFNNNGTMTPGSLRAKTDDMSTATITTLAIALAMGAMFVGIIATIIGKRFYDNWHRRHYQQIDYLVDGMYG